MGHSTDNRQDRQTGVYEHPFWYHTIEIMPGVVTPGWFDLRPVVGWPPDYRATDLAGDPGFTTSISLGPGR